MKYKESKIIYLVQTWSEQELKLEMVSEQERKLHEWPGEMMNSEQEEMMNSEQEEMMNSEQELQAVVEPEIVMKMKQEIWKVAEQKKKIKGTVWKFKK